MLVISTNCTRLTPLAGIPITGSFRTVCAWQYHVRQVWFVTGVRFREGDVKLPCIILSAILAISVGRVLEETHKK